jgi:uncharacterized membrane protein
MKIGLIINWLMAVKFAVTNFSIPISNKRHIFRQEDRNMAAKKKAAKKTVKKKIAKKKAKK